MTIFFRSVEIGEIYVRNSYFFCKNFVKATHLLKKSLNSWFDEIYFQWEFSRFSTLCMVLKTFPHYQITLHCFHEIFSRFCFFHTAVPRLDSLRVELHVPIFLFHVIFLKDFFYSRKNCQRMWKPSWIFLPPHHWRP